MVIENLEKVWRNRNAYKYREFSVGINLIVDFMLPGDLSGLPDDSYSFVGGCYGK